MIDPAEWFQVSRAHRIVARLPKGKTGKEALFDAVKESMQDARRWVDLFSEGSAGDHYLRCYTPQVDQMRLTRAAFEEFLRNGGRTYQGRRL